MDQDLVSYRVIGAAIEVHRELGGPGLMEKVYESCLARELELQGLRVERQVSVPVIYKGEVVRDPLYLDLLVEGKVIVEVKAVEGVCKLHRAQVLTYLRLTGLGLGLILNFGESCLKDGVGRVINGRGRG